MLQLQENLMFGLREGFPGGASGKEPATKTDVRNMGLIPGLGRPPWRRTWQPTPVFLPGESHGWRSLADCSPVGPKSQTRLKRLGGLVTKSGPALATPLTVVCQAPLSMGFSRQECWSG